MVHFHGGMIPTLLLGLSLLWMLGGGRVGVANLLDRHWVGTWVSHMISLASFASGSRVLEELDIRVHVLHIFR